MKKNYFLKIGIALVAMVVLTIQMAAAQNLSVSGVVSGVDKLPIAGVNVIVEGTTTGMVTGLDGTYTINNVAPTAKLVFSFVGYKSQTVAVNGKKQINVTLLEDVGALDEVVVVGYGVQKKSHLTGSVASIDTEGITDVPTSRLDQMLVGKSAGLTISNTSSNAGDAPEISIRGMGSMTSKSSPLIIVDGFPVSGGLESVNAADVESIEILKDAASSAIYGSRAAGGVILITTKSGTADEPRYNLKVTTGTRFAYKQLDTYDTEGYFNITTAENNAYNEYNAAEIAAGNLTAKGPDTFVGSMVWMEENITGRTDWKEMAVGAAQFHNIQGSVSGGTDKVKYYVSGNYAYDESIVAGSDYQKINMRAKVDAQLSKRVSVGVSLAPQYSLKNISPVSYANFATANETWMPMFHTQESIDFIKNGGYNDGHYTVDGVEKWNGGNPSFDKKPGDYAQGKDFSNLVYGVTNADGEYYYRSSSLKNTVQTTPGQQLENLFENQHVYSLNGNAYVNIDIAKGLNFRTSNGFDVRNVLEEEFNNADAASVGSSASGRYETNLAIRLLTENMFTYDKTFGKHSFNVLAGYTAELWKQKNSQIVGNFPTDYVPTLNAASELIKDDTYTGRQEIAMESVLARLTYSYADKYLFSASYRTDGSSKFGPENRYGSFPSVSLGWRLSEEEWMKDVEWVDQLKLRLSYGITGSDNITNYAPYNTLNLVQTIMGGGNGTLASGFANTSSTLGNRALTWEETTEWNGGVDFSLLGGRLSGSVDLYDSETKALLLKQSIPSITGFDSYWNNIGKINNKGIEVELSGILIQKSDFVWSTSLNFATNKNTLVNAGGPDEVYTTAGYATFVARVGEPAIQFVGYKTDGLYMSAEDVAADAGSDTQLAGKAAAGSFKLVTNGDGKLNNEDRQVIGSPIPDFTWGMSHSLNYKNFDLSFTLQGVQGGDIFNKPLSDTGSRKFDKSIVDGRWFGDFPGGRGNGVNPSYNPKIAAKLTDFVIEDASYGALRDLTIGYTLPTTVANKIGMQGLRVYVAGQNLLFVWGDGFRGVNPEVRSSYSSPLVGGIVWNTTPINTTLSIGLDINF